MVCDKITVVVKTIGRSTVKDAVRSATREGFGVLVIQDGCVIHPDISCILLDDVQSIYSHRKVGHYGLVLGNLASLFVNTPYMHFLDDDDEMDIGVGDKMRQFLDKHEDFDIILSGVKYKNGKVKGTNRNNSGCVVGNVACPTYRVEVLDKCPFHIDYPEHQMKISDFLHVQDCVIKQFRVCWYGFVTTLVRPRLEGNRGYEM